jgi:5-methylcytosine-specific restriction endonuclease McrA
MKTKQCSKCKGVKTVDCFGKQKDKKDGLRSHCKSCRSESSRKYRENNPEKVSESCRKYREKNREKVAEGGRKYYDKNREKISEGRRKQYDKNREKEAELSRKWKQANLDKVNAYSQKRRARKQNAPGNATADDIKARFDYYGNKCVYCGTEENLHIEHRIPLSRGGSHHPANLAPACGSCNSSKGTKTETEFKVFLLTRN